MEIEMSPAPLSQNDVRLNELERERIIPLKEAARLRGCHPDTLIKERDRIVEISPRRWGMRVKHALQLTD
jgi:hypothetical protein